MKFKIEKSKDGQFYYTLVANNGEIYMTSETMTQKHSCKDSIDSIRTEEIDIYTEVIDNT